MVTPPRARRDRGTPAAAISRSLAGFAVAGLAATALVGAAGPARAEPEAALKAAVVVNLIQFIQWPDEVHRPDAPLVICADPEAPSWPHLHALTARAPRGAQALELRALPATADATRACHVWLAESAPGLQRAQALAGARQPVLVVADLAAAPAPEAVIELRRSGTRLGFDIDLASARKRGLQVSARLMRVAGKVQE